MANGIHRKIFALLLMNHSYDSLADLLEYPGDDWAARVERVKQLVAQSEAELSASFEEFDRKAAELSSMARQELYTQTFDLNPVCTLDIGYHLFGENYKRGIFLAYLRETEAPYALGQEQQLPDHLPVLLRLLAKLEEPELRRDLIAECLLPALDKMNESLSKTENPYGCLIKTARLALEQEVGPDRRKQTNLPLSSFERPSLPVLQWKLW